MKSIPNRLLMYGIATLLTGLTGLLFGISSVYVYYQYKNDQMSNPSNQCFVSPGQTVVEWKSGIYRTRCMTSVGNMCFWPISRRHYTYKVTLNKGVPLRSKKGTVIPAINGDEKRGWLTYDADSWNALQYDPLGEYKYLDFEPIASNEYVVMVETRYKLFNNLESNLGICTQK